MSNPFSQTYKMSIAIVGTSRLVNYDWLVDLVETLFMPGVFVGEAADGSMLRQRPGVLIVNSKRRRSKNVQQCKKIITGTCPSGVDWYAAKFAQNAMLPLTQVKKDTRTSRREYGRRLVAGANLVLLIEDGEVSDSLEAVKMAADEFAVPIVMYDMYTQAAVYVRCEPIVHETEIVRCCEPQFAAFCVDDVRGAVPTTTYYCIVRFESRDQYLAHSLGKFELLRAQWMSLLPKDMELVGVLRRLRDIDINKYAYHCNEQLRVYNFEACDVNVDENY